MEYIEKITQLISEYEIRNSITYILISLAVAYLVSIKMSTDRRYTLTMLITQMITVGISILSLLMLRSVFDFSFSSYFYISFWFSYIYTLFVLLESSLQYSNLLRGKDFDIDYISRNHFKILISTVPILLLLVSVSLPFVPFNTQMLLIHLAISISISSTLNHLLVRRIIREV